MLELPNAQKSVDGLVNLKRIDLINYNHLNLKRGSQQIVLRITVEFLSVSGQIIISIKVFFYCRKTIFLSSGVVFWETDCDLKFRLFLKVATDGRDILEDVEEMGGQGGSTSQSYPSLLPINLASQVWNSLPLKIKCCEKN